MKEYIKLGRARFGFRDIRIIYFKDSNHTILHRENDQPAVIWNDGTKWYYLNGMTVGRKGMETNANERIH
jgi:hypothetical protein